MVRKAADMSLNVKQWTVEREGCGRNRKLNPRESHSLPRRLKVPWAGRVLGLAAIVWCTSSLSAQTFGEIAGFVRDPSGAMVGGARITARNESTNQKRTVETSEAGGYSIPFLKPGSYAVLAEKEGFKSQSTRSLVLRVEDRVRVNFQLEIGTIEEVVEVVAPTPLLSRESAAIGTVVTASQILDFPLNGRNYVSLVKVSPNVAMENRTFGTQNQRQKGERVEQPISVAGQRLEFNRYTLDGVENTDVNFNTYLVRPPVDALREFKVQTGVYAAEHGRSTSQIIVATKSGTNEFHGAVFEFHRNREFFDAAPWRAESENDPLIRNQFGFALGGPIVRNKLFFLSSLEILRQLADFEQPSTVATDPMRAGDLAGQGRPIFDPLSRVFEVDDNGNERAVAAARFPNDVIPQHRFNPAALKLLEFYPRATRPGEDIFNNFRWQAFNRKDFEQLLQRLDYQESSHSSWFGRFSWGNERQEGSVAGPFPTQTGRTETRVYQGMISNTRVLSPTMLNELRLSYSQFQNDVVGHFARRRDVVSELGILGLQKFDPSVWGVPGILLSNGLRSFGDGFDGPWVNRNHIFHAQNNVSVVKGNHSLKFGGEIRRDSYNHLGSELARGFFGFFGGATADPQAPGTSGHSFADFLLGENTLAARSMHAGDARLRATSFSFYLQDTWRVTSRLTLDLGLRYEYTPPYHDKFRGIINPQLFDPGVGADGLREGTRHPILTRPGEGDFYEGLNFRYADGIAVQAGNQFLGRRLVATDRTDWAPRLGIAWSPADNWTIRTGAGLFYAQDIGNARFDMTRNLLGIDVLFADPQRPNSNLSDPWAFSRQAFPCTGWEGICIGRPLVIANDARRRTPYVWQWMFDLQRELNSAVVIGAGYQGNAGHKLERTRLFNQGIHRAGPSDSTPLTLRQPWPEYWQIQRVDGTVNSNYHALTLKAESRFSMGLSFLAGYTWAKAIDTGSAIGVNLQGDRRAAANSYDLDAERGLSQFHIGQRLTASFLYDLPFGRGKSFLSGGELASKVLGGWRIGSILTLSEGGPNSVGGIGDRNNTGTGSYPDATGISPSLEDATPDRFWNANAFDTVNPELSVREGSVGRSVLMNPGFGQWDFSLLKDVTIREGQRLQIRFEAFNFSNHPNLIDPFTDPTNPNIFGRVPVAKRMREIQFGVKYLF